MAEQVRIDKWLWAARFFKTRTLAAEAVRGGKVHLNGRRTKPSRAITLGDRIEIRKGPYRIELVVTGLSERRLPAKEARHLYRETPESEAQRRAIAEQRKLERLLFRATAAKPDKRERRRLKQIKRGS